MVKDSNFLSSSSSKKTGRKRSLSSEDSSDSGEFVEENGVQNLLTLTESSEETTISFDKSNMSIWSMKKELF